MVSSEPLVSVVIPVYNGERFVAEAIRSVVRQTHRSLEYIVVDDGSTDDTANVARGIEGPVKVTTQDNAGVSAARNRGAADARGDLLAFLDADDVWHPEKLRRQLSLLRGSPHVGLVLCDLQLVDEGLRAQQMRRMRVTPMLAEEMVLGTGAILSCSSTALVPRHVFREIGGFDVDLSMSADWDFLMRVALHHPVASVPEPLTLYRMHSRNMSHDVALLERDKRRAYEKLFSDPRWSERLGPRRRRAHANLHRMLAGSYLHAHDYRGACRNAAVSLRWHPAILAYSLALPIRRWQRTRGERADRTATAIPTDSRQACDEMRDRA
jgi:glycosyltransferase involved in cell wall biosynthesis